MSNRYLHIISLDVPYPANYGGVIDIFYKLKHLHRAGIRIYLHCFTNGRPPQEELDNYCEEIFYYKRKKKLSAFPFNVPYMVASRNNDALLENLKKDNYPVLIEGIQCSFLLYKNLLKDRKVYLRLHNAEYRYYHKLAEHESNFIKRWYYRNESRLLKKYENNISAKASILALSKSDIAIYRKIFSPSSIYFIPAFTAWDKVNAIEGNGKYCLYHGNLAINENEKAVEWLLENVYSKIAIPFIVAGKQPSTKLEAKIFKYSNCSLIKNPSNDEMQALVMQAQINVIPSFNNTGVKLKLLNALYNGRHCLVNKAGVEGSELQTVCTVAESPETFFTITTQLFKKEFLKEDAIARQLVLDTLYNNKKNAENLISLINFGV